MLQKRMNDVLAGLKIPAICVCAEQNRHLVFFDLKLGENCTVSKIEKNLREISLHLRTLTVPFLHVDSARGIVRLRAALSSPELVHVAEINVGRNIPQDSILSFCVGYDDEGNNLVVDFAKNPHTLIAGATGSGKSVLLHNLIANAVFLQLAGQPVDIHLVDPKRVEFSAYEDSVFGEYISSISYDYNSCLRLLSGLEKLMETKYKILSKHGLKSIVEAPGMSSQIIIIDEVADLMLQDETGQFEQSVVKLAQKARAAGIHLILATQRPSVDVLTGLIKANFPARIACRTSSRVDSQVILDEPGAQELIGKGDALFKTDSFGLKRFQAAFASPQNLKKNIHSVKLAA